MAFDGITIACLREELAASLTGGRITKIAQPEADELLLTIKSAGGQYRLLLSASASLPLAYLTETGKPSPLTAPNFCMLLRKHLGGGRIVSITQPSLERILHLEIEHLNEMGDLCRKKLIIELMGKHSNIIFCNEDGMILDSIKHVSSAMSSVREVLPGRPYFIPETQEKLDPLTAGSEAMLDAICAKAAKLSKAIYTTLTGFSPIMAEELCFRAGLDSDLPAVALEASHRQKLGHVLEGLLLDIKLGRFAPQIVYRDKEPVEFSCLPLTLYGELECRSFNTVSQLLEVYYASKSTITRIRQKSSDLRRIVQTALERNRKKYDLQYKQLQDTEKRDKYRIYGELINTYGYQLEPDSKSLTALNYYTNEEITIPLDPQMTPQENAKKYFEKYNKLKRTCEAVTKLLSETEEEIGHLESISTSLDIALLEEDLVQVKEELMEYGYIKKRRSSDKKPKVTSKPFHYLSSDGFHIYVGKNNFQNEELTFRFATGNDWWFHAKGVPGSHVIVKAEGQELPDRTFEEAGRLAAYYSRNRNSEKVEIDYLQRKNVKKPGGSKPGFVVYYTNYSLMIDPDISGLTQLS